MQSFNKNKAKKYGMRALCIAVTSLYFLNVFQAEYKVFFFIPFFTFLELFPLYFMRFQPACTFRIPHNALLD